jgi:hypothetical protein
MSLKAKLYILKNPTLLLLGPSSFEHWFKSYLCITVGSLSFLKIATGSSFVYLPPSSSVSSLRRRRSGQPCAPPPPPQCCPAPGHMPFPASPPPSPTPRWPSLLLPRRPTVRPSRPSPLLAIVATPRYLLLPGDPTCRSPAGRRRSLPQLPSSARATPIPPLPSLTVPPRALPVCQLLLARSHILSWTPSTSYCFSSTRPCICTPPFRSISPAPITSLHPTPAAVPGHRRQPPPSSPNPDPVPQQHCHDP